MLTSGSIDNLEKGLISFYIVWMFIIAAISSDSTSWSVYCFFVRASFSCLQKIITPLHVLLMSSLEMKCLKNMLCWSVRKCVTLPDTFLLPARGVRQESWRLLHHVGQLFWCFNQTSLRIHVPSHVLVLGNPNSSQIQIQLHNCANKAQQLHSILDKRPLVTKL